MLCTFFLNVVVHFLFLNVYLQMIELSKSIRELKIILYGNGESEPLAEACAQLTLEFFRENTLRLIINCLPNLNLEVRQHLLCVQKVAYSQIVSLLSHHGSYLCLFFFGESTIWFLFSDLYDGSTTLFDHFELEFYFC